MIMLKTLMAPGSTIAHRVSIMPRSRIRMYLGMRPPSKYMVKTNTPISRLRPIIRFLAKAKAQLIVTNKFMAVPRPV